MNPHLHAETEILPPQSNTRTSDSLTPALPFKLCQGYCGEFTAECTHCSFPGSTMTKTPDGEIKTHRKMKRSCHDMFLLW